MNLSEDWYQTAIKKFKINEIPHKEFSRKPTRIGRGGFGLIYKTECDFIGTVAIKEITIDIEDDETCIKNFINELKIHSRIEHERIIQFYGISRNIDDGLYYLVLEYANQGNLREFLIKKRNCRNCDDCFEWKERVRLAVQIVEGLRYLHEILNITHRDLHTKNILLNDGNVKISDFGLSKNLNSTLSSNNKFFGMIPFIDPQKLNHGKKYVLNKRSDVYSLGVILWEISSCRTPFHGEDLAYLSLKICQGLREKSVKGTPMDYKRIYTSCWEVEPNSRPLIEEVLSQLESMSLKPVFEEDDNVPTICPLPNPDTSRNSTSEYSNNVASLTIPDDLTLPTNNVICKGCDSQFTDQNWCHNCEPQKVQENFPNWTSGNESLDEIIQYSQLSAINNNTYFEWINFDRFDCIENMQGFPHSEFYTATWLDGIRELWDNESQQWVRTGPVKIILRKLSSLTINKLKLYLELKNIIICCYGFTRDPITRCYYIVLKYTNGVTLQQYIQNKFSISWSERLSILKKIVELLHSFHKTNYVYCNLHSRSLLLQYDDLNHKLEIYVSDLNSCIYDYKARLENYPLREIFEGKSINSKWDIYNFGDIMRELVSYSSSNTPQCYYELMQRCLNLDPEKRPDTFDLLEEFHIFTTFPFRKRLFEDADRNRNNCDSTISVNFSVLNGESFIYGELPFNRILNII
ncbi:hypothetical protein RclHR1_03490009 [Rhizophagus clarus]|uniref:Kinase-like domain-containing protein n=1 Tax=Rhizophagus clarus TaxID=94130 RepID=A0A2Z6RAE8_9GLOM|nr:hypothetical protein RclHR1_03490009 [Rhizophagus clarus]GES89828.1 kinase-like domain-containing protein [Rhizophagus clarus]